MRDGIRRQTAAIARGFLFSLVAFLAPPASRAAIINRDVALIWYPHCFHRVGLRVRAKEAL